MRACRVVMTPLHVEEDVDSDDDAGRDAKQCDGEDGLDQSLGAPQYVETIEKRRHTVPFCEGAHRRGSNGCLSKQIPPNMQTVNRPLSPNRAPQRKLCP